MLLERNDLLIALELINDALMVSNPEQLGSLWAKMQYSLGIDGVIFGTSKSVSDSDLTAPEIIAYGIPQKWLETYQKENLTPIDPVVHFCIETQIPVSWQSAFVKYADTHQKFIQAAYDHGLVNGYAVAKFTHSFTKMASLTSVTTNDTEIDPRQEVLLQNILPHLNEIMVRPGFSHAPKLSARELEVLNWAKDGKSYWETSKILNISERTVKFHLENCYRKLGVSNKAQAIATALSHALIKLD
jgi:LuxR family transcriptional activator of bioluminescence operon